MTILPLLTIPQTCTMPQVLPTLSIYRPRFYCYFFAFFPAEEALPAETALLAAALLVLGLVARSALAALVLLLIVFAALSPTIPAALAPAVAFAVSYPAHFRIEKQTANDPAKISSVTITNPCESTASAKNVSKSIAAASLIKPVFGTNATSPSGGR